MAQNALVVTDGLLDDMHAKTCHGLLRGSERFRVVGVVDAVHAGKNANDVVAHARPGVPVCATLADAIEKSTHAPECLIIGVATKGGVLPENLRALVLDAIRAGLDIVNGLHETLGDDADIGPAAARAKVTIHDVRRPKPFRELHFWEGTISDVDCPIIGVLGTDCAVGKRTTAKLLTEAMKADGQAADMIYTGQTGWMLGYSHGFIFDSTPNDFVSGEMEHAIVSCWNDSTPDVIFLEGQSALRNPSGPCGSEFLLSAQARAVVLAHPVGREHYSGTDTPLPSVADEMALIKMYGAETIAVALNAAEASPEACAAEAQRLRDELGIPVADPFDDIVPLVDAVKRYVASYPGGSAAS